MSKSPGRTNISSGARWEPIVGYSRAVRVGSYVAVSGSAAISQDGELVGAGDAYEQTRQCIRVIEDSLAKAGASLRDVVRTRTFVTDITLWPQVAKAHGEAFGEVLPATSMLEVSRLIDPAMLVEIEADAIVDSG